jgi:hypothetical protein
MFMRPSLAKIIRGAGYYCVRDRAGIYRIAESRASDRVLGIAFTVFREKDAWMIGLLSARTYRCGGSSDIAAIVLDLLSGEYVSRGRIPYVLPDAFLRKYNIALTE